MRKEKRVIESEIAPKGRPYEAAMEPASYESAMEATAMGEPTTSAAHPSALPNRERRDRAEKNGESQESHLKNPLDNSLLCPIIGV